MTAPELCSVEAFVEHLIDDERATFTRDELVALSAATTTSIRTLLPALQSYGLALERTDPPRRVRGFKANCHNRWDACPSGGGSGWQQIAGFAGSEG